MFIKKNTTLILGAGMFFQLDLAGDLQAVKIFLAVVGVFHQQIIMLNTTESAVNKTCAQRNEKLRTLDGHFNPYFFVKSEMDSTISIYFKTDTIHERL